MIVRDATPADIAEVARTSISRGMKQVPDWTWATYALEHEGKVLTVGGLILVNETTAWFWFNNAAAAREHMIGVYRFVRDWLKKLMDLHGIKRCMASVDSTFPEAILMVEHLGFRQESILEKFYGDVDGYMYVLFRE
jgi:L-amino acid N-acyltransferase YncA